MKSYPPSEKLVSREIKEYMRDDEKLSHCLQLYTDVYEIHRKFAQHTEIAVSEKSIGQDHIRTGKPLLRENTIHIPADVFKSLVSSTMIAVKKYLPENSLYLLDILKQNLSSEENIAFFCDPVNLTDENLRQFLVQCGIPAEDKETFGVFMFFTFSIARFFYASYAEGVREQVDLSLWEKGDCPICGQKPSMAMLRSDDGARLLECGLCHTRWQFYRLVCHECGNRDHKSLGFFYLPQKENRRVYVCNRCKSYLKTTVLKGLGREIIPDLENIATLYLDYLAQGEGYTLSGCSANLTSH